MGLLRRAAVAVGGEPPQAKPGAAVKEKKPSRGPGLLRRSLQARQKHAEAAPAAESLPEPSAVFSSAPAPAMPAPLTIELAGEPAVQVPLPLRVEASSLEPETALAAGPVPAIGMGPAHPDAGRFRPVKDVIEEVRTAITALRGGTELPSRLFTAISSLLGIHKGAFLLYDAVRLVYAPWAQRGYDQTTRHRLRISLGANEAWNALANGRPLVLSGAPALAAFQPFFSSREFASVQQLVLAPFIADDRLAAVLLVTDMDSPLATEAELIEALAAAAETGAPRVQDARAARMAAAEPGAGRPEAAAARDDMTQFLAALSGRPEVLLVSLSLEDFSRHVLAAHEDLDSFRLHEDLQFFLGTFLADVGKAMAVRPGRFTVALPDFERAGLDVFGHQLSLFLHGLFDGDGAPGAADEAGPIRVLRTASWPADGPDLRKLVESLSS